MKNGIVNQWEKSTPVCLSSVAVNKVRGWVPDAYILTDDLQMQGVQKLMSSGEACVQAVRAGADLIIIGNNIKDGRSKRRASRAICARPARKIRWCGLTPKRPSIGASSHHDLSLAAFITNIAESDFRYAVPHSGTGAFLHHFVGNAARDPRRAAHGNRCFDAYMRATDIQGRVASSRNVSTRAPIANLAIRPRKGIFDADLHVHVGSQL